MTTVYSFTFNPFSENTYIITSDTKECWVIDPGCYTENEKKQLFTFLKNEGLQPVQLLNTHCHLDHIFGNAFISETYALSPIYHQSEDMIAKNAALAAMMFGVKAPEYVKPERFIQEGEVLTLGDHSFQVLLTPGHSPGSLCFYNEEASYVIAGDVLFRESIGRTDLPGGNYDMLIASIKNKLFTLPDHVTVYNGHGPSTTIGHEKRFNPFLR